HQKPHPKEAPSEIPAPGDEIRRSHNHGGRGGHNGAPTEGPLPGDEIRGLDNHGGPGGHNGAPSEVRAPGDEIRRSHNHGGPGGHTGSASHGPSSKHPGSANYEDDHGNAREKVELSHERVGRSHE